jgi:hypothetical protein
MMHSTNWMARLWIWDQWQPELVLLPLVTLE